jgi:glutaredoxin
LAPAYDAPVHVAHQLFKENRMKSKAVFYHAGCPVCVEAEQNIAQAMDPAKYDVEIVHLGQNKARLKDAKNAGVKSVPALVLDGAPFHINFGAAIEALQ